MSGQKKIYIELPPVEEFARTFSAAERKEYDDIVTELELNGFLRMPTGEKIDSSLFAIRIIKAANIRVFYAYGTEDRVWGLHGYVKKSQQIPVKEMKQAQKLVKALQKKGWIK